MNLLVMLPLLFFFVLVCEGLLADLASGQGSYCDPSLSQSADNPYGYRLRGDRCEGIYIKEVSTTILIASFTESFEDYDLNSGKALQVEWHKASGNESVRLRSRGLRRRLYYRMDTVRPPGSTSYTWPLDILAALNLQRKDIGVVGLTRYAVGESERDVYIPLRIRQRGNLSQSGSYKLVLVPGVELTKMFISLVPVGTDGHPHAFLKADEALSLGFYPAERGIDIPLSGLTTPGICYLRIGATLSSGGTSTVEIWFYHPGS
jgi:hypothetical protein